MKIDVCDICLLEKKLTIPRFVIKTKIRGCPIKFCKDHNNKVSMLVKKSDMEILKVLSDGNTIYNEMIRENR